MGWAETRAAARATVHESFGLVASYTPPGVGAIPVTGITVRWHTRTVRHGDLDREGYPQLQEDVTRIMLDTAEVPEPVRNALIVVDGVGTYAIDTVLPFDGRFVPCDVVRVG